MLWPILEPTSSFAQDDASMNKMLDEIGAQKGKAADKTPIPRPTGATASLNVHWKSFLRANAAKEPGTEALKALAHNSRSLGLPNQPAHAMAVASLAMEIDDYDVGRKVFDGAQELAPQLPYPFLMEASWVLGHHPELLPNWVKPWWTGVSNGVAWPDTSYAWLLKLLSFLLVALGAGALVFILGQFIRNFGIVAYDFARLLPSGFSSNQSALVLVALITVPGLLTQSPLVSLLIILVMCAAVQRTSERIVSVLVFALLASLPTFEALLSKVATYPESVAQKIVHAQWIGCDSACRESFDHLAAEHPEDDVLRFTALLAAYRDGSPANLRRVIEEVESTTWSPAVAGYASNLAGAAHVALANPKDALPLLQRARDQIRHSAAPPFNMMRAQQMLGDDSATTAALTEASQRDIDLVSAYLELDRRDVNSHLIAAALPLRLLSRYQLEHADPARSVDTIRPLYELVAGKGFAFEHTRTLGALGILLTLLMGLLAQRSSTPCPRCGQARDPSEESKTGNHAYCVPCYSTFIAGASLDYDARVHNERVLSRRDLFHRMMRRGSGFIVPGLGHQVAGHAVSGFAITCGLAFCVAIIVNPAGIVRAPHELFLTNWTAQVTFAWFGVALCVIALISAAKDDLEPVTQPKRGER